MWRRGGAVRKGREEGESECKNQGKPQSPKGVWADLSDTQRWQRKWPRVEDMRGSLASVATEAATRCLYYSTIYISTQHVFESPQSLTDVPTRWSRV